MNFKLLMGVRNPHSLKLKRLMVDIGALAKAVARDGAALSISQASDQRGLAPARHNLLPCLKI
jgi:hypothetical protein